MPDTKIKALDGDTFDAYCAVPKSGQGPGLLIAHEIFGLNATMRALCDALAEKGFLTLCPNLYWRQNPKASLSDENGDDLDSALRLYQDFDIEAGVRDLLASLAHLRCLSACSGKVGVMGSCLGSRMAYLMAARSDVDCAVGVYGVGFESMLDEASDIRQPALFHFAENDKFCPPSAREKIAKVFAKNPAIHVEIYPGVEHGFMRKAGSKYNPTEAAKLEQSTLAFLTERLLS